MSKNTKTVIAAPGIFRSTKHSHAANSAITDAGYALQKLAGENTALHEERVELLDKISSAERKAALFAVATRLAGKGVLKHSSIEGMVSQWHSEGRAPSYYEELHSTRVDLSFAAAGGAPEKTSSRVLDTPVGSMQDGRQSTDHFDHNALLRYGVN